MQIETECQPTIHLESLKASAIHVLHVDDDLLLLEMSKKILLDMDSSFEIDNACCVDEAFKKLAVGNYDVVVSDYEMPQKTGLQFLKELREAKNEIPFILFTGKGREDVAITALNLGADGYYSKLGSPETVYGELSHGIRLFVEHKKGIKSEEKFQVYLENSPIAFVVGSSEGIIEDVNQEACKLSGYSKEEIIKKPIFDFVFEEDISTLMNQLSLVISEERIQLECRLKKKNGEPVNVFIKAAKLPDGRLMAFLEDITKRKRDEECLRRGQEELKAIVLNAPLGIATSDSNMIFQSANNAFCRILGYSEDELRKITFREITSKESIPSSSKCMSDLVSGNTSFFNQEKRYIRKDGTIIDGRVTVSALSDKEGKPVLFIAELEDITNHKKAKRELEESEERYRSLFEQAPIPVIISTIDGTILDANNAMQTFTGYSLSELKRISTKSLYEDPQDRKRLLEIFERDGVVSDFFTQLKDKNSNIIAVVLNVSKFLIGKESFLRTTIQDVSDRVKAEETLSQIMDQLVLVNEKLGVIGSLTRHDVRNKLSVVTGYAYLLKKKYADKTDIVDGLSKMQQAVNDSMKIFEFAKMYEQLGSEDPIFIDVESTLNEAITLFSRELPPLINGCHGLTVLADSFLRQLFYNFIDNTRKYGKKTTSIRVHYEKTDSGDLQLIYEDDGVGISAENKSKLFFEGFSTGGSTGFGLFLIRKMMNIYGWTIQETGVPNKGARFIITIPEKNKLGKTNYRIQQ